LWNPRTTLMPVDLLLARSVMRERLEKTTTTAPPPDERTRQKRARRWRGLIAAGGLLLASTFFMPAVQGCNASIVPAQEVREHFTASGISKRRLLC